METNCANLYYDFYREEKLKEPPPRPDLVYIDNSGKPACISKDPEVRKEFNKLSN